MTVHMVQFNDCGKSYKTTANAKKQLDKFMVQFNELFKDQTDVSWLRCGISGRDDGRYVPFVLHSSVAEIPGATTYVIHNNFGVVLLG